MKKRILIKTTSSEIISSWFTQFYLNFSHSISFSLYQVPEPAYRSHLFVLTSVYLSAQFFCFTPLFQVYIWYHFEHHNHSSNDVRNIQIYSMNYKFDSKIELLFVNSQFQEATSRPSDIAFTKRQGKRSVSDFIFCS